jgi:uncharacterized protein YjbI with pentapeptide repeats
MELVNTTGLIPAWILGRLEPPVTSLIVVVKGTFNLRPGEPAILAEEQPAPTGDEFEEKNPEKPLRYPVDFAPYKPGADLMLAGHCHPPGGKAAPSARVIFRVGNRSKELHVHGDRTWDEDGRMTGPAPFRSMPLTWAHAFGGAGFERNPLGKGFKRTVRGDGSAFHSLPNIEDPNHLIRTPRDRVEPVCFSPIPETWPQRLKKFPRPNSRYMKERWPGYPENMDWRFFNAASEDQQMESYLRGDERLYFENMHSGIPEYHSQLPGWRVRCFLNQQVRARQELREIPMSLDTLWVDMDAEQVVLVWRGNISVKNEKLTEVLHLFVAREELANSPGDIQQINYAFRDALWRMEEAEEDELEPEDEEDEDELDEEDEEEAEKDEAGEPDEKADAVPAATTSDEAAPEPSSPSTEVPSATEDRADPEEQPVEEPVEEDEAEEEADDMTPAMVQQMIAQRESLSGRDLSGLNLEGFDFSGLDLRETILEGASLAGANLSEADLSGAILAGANLNGARCVKAIFAGADLTESWMVRADLTEANLLGADLSKADLRQAVLVRVNAQDAILVEANLSDAVVQGSSLVGADLCHARLHHADLSNADLTDAAFEHAWGRQLKATHAVVKKIRAANAMFCEADFSHATGDESVWEGAQLYGAKFNGASLYRAEFSGALLVASVFDAAEIKEARMDEARLHRAQLRRCNLFEASLSKADLTEANLAESNLYGATLMDSILVQTNLTGANLRRIKSRQGIP